MFALLMLVVAVSAGSDSAPQPQPTDLPEIGRVRAISPACGVMRDLIIPSFRAAREADARFVDTSKNLIRYVGGVADDSTHSPAPPVLRERLLNMVGNDKTKLLQNAQIIANALGDPRLSVDSLDPAVQSEREQLQSLYEAQINRAGLLNQFVMREENAIAMTGVGSTTAFGGRNLRPATAPDARETSTPAGMPILTGLIGSADGNSMRDWSDQIRSGVRSNENQVAKAFYAIATSCVAK